MKQLDQHRPIDKFSSLQISILYKNRPLLKTNTFTKNSAFPIISYTSSYFLQAAHTHRLTSRIRESQPVQNSISFKNTKQLMF